MRVVCRVDDPGVAKGRKVEEDIRQDDGYGTRRFVQDAELRPDSGEV
jgi:hypothetical protein